MVKANSQTVIMHSLNKINWMESFSSPSNLFLIVLFFGVFASVSYAQKPGYIDEFGDTIDLIQDRIPLCEFCLDECYQFVMIPFDIDTNRFILYPDRIKWLNKNGTPETSSERDPFVCYHETFTRDTVYTGMQVYDKLFNKFNWHGVGHANVHVVKCPPIASFEPERRIICAGESLDYYDLSRRAPDEWFWNFEGGTPNSWEGSDPPPIRYAEPGIYTSELLVRNDVGDDVLIESQLIEVLPGPDQVTDANQVITIAFGDTIQLHACSIGENYQWSPAEGLSCTDCPNPILEVNHTSEYQVVVGLDGLVCEDTCSFALTVLPVEERLWFPNVFTPNGDGINDIFEGYGAHIELKELKIYDRWGSIVFSSISPNAGWDGTRNGIELQPATYIYSAVFEGRYSGETKNIAGEVLLRR